MAAVATNFLRDEGPDVLGTYAPWAVDILPLPTWIQLGVALSLLFSAMSLRPTASTCGASTRSA